MEEGRKGCGVDVSGRVQVRGTLLAALAKGQTRNAGSKLFMPQSQMFMLCCSLWTTCVFAGFVDVLCCEFEKGRQSVVTVIKRELRSRHSRRRNTGLGRLTDPSAWAELEALYGSHWAWVLGYVPPRLSKSISVPLGELALHSPIPLWTR